MSNIEFVLNVLCFCVPIFQDYSKEGEKSWASKETWIDPLSIVIGPKSVILVFSRECKMTKRRSVFVANTRVLLVLVALSLACLCHGYRVGGNGVYSGRRRWRQTKLHQAEEEEGESLLSDEARAKIKAEISSPFRLLRQFIYVGMGAAGGLGTFTAVPQLLFALQDGGDAVGTAVTNIAVDVGAIIGAVVLWDREASGEKAKVERFTEKEKKVSAQLSPSILAEREAEIALLPVEIVFSEKNENVTKIVKFGDLQSKGKQSVIVVAGSQAFVKDAVMSARIEGNELFNANNICVVPVVLAGDAQLDANLGKGFGAKEALLGAPYIGKPAQVNVWEAYLNKEVEAAEQQGELGIVKKGLVLAVNSSGKIVRRGVGLPPWQKLMEEMKGGASKK